MTSLDVFDDLPLPSREELVRAFVPAAAPTPLIRPRWAVVQQVSPLRVQMVGDPTVVPVEPETLTQGLRVGDRVWTALTDKGALIVVGPAGGPRNLPVPAEAIGGGADLDTYVSTGTWVVESDADAAGGTNFPAPYAGWLEVGESVTPGSVWHRYTTLHTAAGGTRVWVRSFTGATWGPWSCLNPGEVRAKMTKSTAGHTSAGTNYTSNTWQRISGFDIVDYEVGITADETTGGFTALEVGRYDFDVFFRWGSIGSANLRTGAIVKGTSSPATDASNVLAISAASGDGYLLDNFSATDVPLEVGDTVSFWIRPSSHTGPFNEADTAIPGWTHVAASLRG